MEKNTHRIDKNTIFQYVADDVIFDKTLTPMLKQLSGDEFFAIKKNDIQFVIPVYQRNYDWTIKECKVLLNDIKDAFLLCAKFVIILFRIFFFLYYL